MHAAISSSWWWRGAPSDHLVTMASGSAPPAGMMVTIDTLEVFWPYVSMYKEQYLYMQELIKGAAWWGGVWHVVW